MAASLLWALTFFYVLAGAYIRYKSSPWGSLVEWETDSMTAALLLAMAGLAHVKARSRYVAPLALLVATYLTTGIELLGLASLAYTVLVTVPFLKSSDKPVIPIYLCGAGIALLAARELGMELGITFFSLLFGALSAYSLVMGPPSRTALVPLLSLAASIAVVRMSISPLPHPSMSLLFMALGGAALGSAVLGRGRKHLAHIPLLITLPVLAYVYPYASGATAYKLALVEHGAVVFTGLPYPYPPSVGLIDVMLGDVSIGSCRPPAASIKVDVVLSAGPTTISLSHTYGLDDIQRGSFMVAGVDIPWYMGDLRLAIFQPSYPLNVSTGEILWGPLSSRILEGFRRVCGDGAALEWVFQVLGRRISPSDLDKLTVPREAPWVVAFRPVPFLWLLLALSLTLPFFLLYFVSNRPVHKT